MNAQVQPQVILYSANTAPPCCPKCGASIQLPDYALSLFRGCFCGYFDTRCQACGLSVRLVGQ